MKVLVVVSIEIPHPDNIVDVLDHIDPPKIPFFDGQVRIVPEPVVIKTLLQFLDEE